MKHVERVGELRHVHYPVLQAAARSCPNSDFHRSVADGRHRLPIAWWFPLLDEEQVVTRFGACVCGERPHVLQRPAEPLDRLLSNVIQDSDKRQVVVMVWLPNVLVLRREDGVRSGAGE